MIQKRAMIYMEARVAMNQIILMKIMKNMICSKRITIAAIAIKFLTVCELLLVKTRMRMRKSFRM